MAECILRDFKAENSEIAIVVTNENSLRFFRDLQKKLTQRSLSTQFKAYQIIETYVRSSPSVMERAWKVVALKSASNGDKVENPIELFRDKNVLLLRTMIDSGHSIDQLAQSLAQIGPRKLKIAVAFHKNH